VYDDVALQDALAIYRFLQRREILSCSVSSPASVYTSTPPPLTLTVRPATPLSGVDMIKANKCGVVAWRVHPGDEVEAGALLGEIVDIDDVDAPRVPLVTSTAGVVFGRRGHKLVRP
jgi:predicted deacylase